MNLKFLIVKVFTDINDELIYLMNEPKLAESMHSFIHSLMYRLTFVLKTCLAEEWDTVTRYMKRDNYGL
jgi:hypothetical protein